jgi:hypothetical protein
VFPGLDISDMLIIPTCQRSVLDLVKTGEDVEAEKDFCLERFVEWSEKVCSALKESGHWADYIDPCSGLPVCSTTVHPLCSRCTEQSSAPVPLLHACTTTPAHCGVALQLSAS